MIFFLINYFKYYIREFRCKIGNHQWAMRFPEDIPLCLRCFKWDL